MAQLVEKPPKYFTTDALNTLYQLFLLYFSSFDVYVV